MELGGRYDVTTPASERIGVLEKVFGKSLLRSTWRILDASDEARVDSHALAARRVRRPRRRCADVELVPIAAAYDRARRARRARLRRPAPALRAARSRRPPTAPRDAECTMTATPGDRASAIASRHAAAASTVGSYGRADPARRRRAAAHGRRCAARSSGSTSPASRASPGRRPHPRRQRLRRAHGGPGHRLVAVGTSRRCSCAGAQREPLLVGRRRRRSTEPVTRSPTASACAARS